MDMSRWRTGPTKFLVCPACGFYFKELPEGTRRRIDCPRCGRRLLVTNNDRILSIMYRVPRLRRA